MAENIKALWPFARLGDLAEFRNGVNYNRSSFGEGIRVVGVSSFQHYVKPRYSELDQINPEGVVREQDILTDGDIVFVRSNGNPELIGRSLFVESPPGRVTHSGFTIRLRFTTPRTHPRFFAYLFRTQLVRQSLTAKGGGTNISNLNQDILSGMDVPVPPLPVQRRIAGVLSNYDDLIDNCERRIRLLDEMARAVYREWFVEFRYPGHVGVPIAESSLGRHPRGWNAKRLDAIVHVHRGRSYRSADVAEEGGVPFVNLKCLDRDGGFRRRGIKRFVGTAPESHAVRTGDIVVAVTDMTQERRVVARAALVPTLDTSFGVLSMDLVRLEPIAPYPAAWVYGYLRYSNFADHLKLHANGANVLHLSPDRIREYVLVAPPSQLTVKFEAKVAPMIHAQNVLENRVENLRESRDLLLPRLLSGQLALDAVA